jgi:pSer/pThr/pTyr-binding forkhead associated (FHA) protein
MSKALLLSNAGGWSLRIKPGDDVVLGRGEDTAHPIPDKLTDRRHVRVRYAGGRCTIEDLKSTSGTYLNGKLVHQPEPLAEGDVIRIGPFEISVASVG